MLKNMKPRSLKPREYRDFLGRRPGVPISNRHHANSGQAELTLERQLRAQALALKRFFETDPLTQVGFQIPIQFDRNHPEHLAFPALWVVRRAKPGVPAIHSEGNYVVADGSPPPDWVLEYSTETIKPEECLTKAHFYLDEVGSAEYFLWMPHLPEHLRIKAFHRKKGEIRRIGPWMNQWHSSRLNLDFGAPEGILSVFDARAGIQLPTPLEWIQQRFAEEERLKS